MTIKQAYDLFITDREAFCEEITVQNYRNCLSYFLAFLDDLDRNINTITVLDLNAYVLYLRKKDAFENHAFKKSGGKLTKKTIHTYSVHLKAFFKFLYENEYIEKDITKRFKLIREEKKIVMPISFDEMEEINLMFNHKTELCCRNLCIVHLMIDAGLRSSEVCDLQLRNIHFHSSLIFIESGKGDKDRIIPLASCLKKVLHNYINLYRSASQHDYVICSQKGGQFTKNAMGSLFARIKKRTGINRISPHLLRHTFATSYLIGGGDLESLRLYMGHADLSTTQKYLHLANVYRYNLDIYQLDRRFFRKGY